MTSEERAAAFIGATEMAPGHDAGDLAFALAGQFEVVRLEERRAIVAWLKRVAEKWIVPFERSIVPRVLADEADRIELGEHLAVGPT